MTEAAAVISRLLDYIDRVDIASQLGSPRPEFKTVDGGPIFPEDSEDPWWLTAMQKKPPDEEQAQAADEDGPASEVDEDEPHEVSDDDPLSSCGTPSTGVLTYEPVVAWTRS